MEVWQETTGMKCLNKDTRFSKVTRMQVHQVTTKYAHTTFSTDFEKL